MIGCLQTRVHKQPISALYFEFENEPNFFNIEARGDSNIKAMDEIMKWV